MDKSSIQWRIKQIIIWSKFVRICPVKIIPSIIPSKKGTVVSEWDHFCYKACNIQYFYNLGYIIMIGILGVISEALLCNLTTNPIQKVGFVSYVLTTMVLPLLIIFISNRNTPQVKHCFHMFLFLIVLINLTGYANPFLI